jgi:hypothetical protein
MLKKSNAASTGVTDDSPAMIAETSNDYDWLHMIAELVNHVDNLTLAVNWPMGMSGGVRMPAKIECMVFDLSFDFDVKKYGIEYGYNN